jgi:hypothetical protein
MRIMDNLWGIGASLEPEVHIADRYMQLVKGFFTMTNIMLESGKEIAPRDTTVEFLVGITLFGAILRVLDLLFLKKE